LEGKMKSRFIPVLIVLLFSFFTLNGQNSLQIEEMVFCKNIKNTEPVDIDSSFYDTVQKVFCFTKVVGATDSTTISHIWYFNNEEIAEVDLNINSPSWRTWSSKNILKSWDGIWRVDIYSASGVLLKSKEFSVHPSD